MGRQSLNIAVVGSGISGLSCAWLLSKGHNVTVFEASGRIGGHSHTVDVEGPKGPIAVDTGFIVYNEPAYPNLTALFRHLNVETNETNMSFSVSRQDGAFEYSGGTGLGLIAQKSNLINPRFLSMMRDIVKFYRQAPRDLAHMDGISLDDYLAKGGYSRAFCEDHLYPMAAAIWSTPAMEVGRYPAANFVNFCANHGLLKIFGRPVWRTVKGGSREYVRRLTQDFRDRILLSTPIEAIIRHPGMVELRDADGNTHHFDDVVIATHADQALRLLGDGDENERRILGAFRYTRNEVLLHTDASLMPKRRAAWSSWNYRDDVASEQTQPSITYWMNRLQRLGKDAPQIFVSLNARRLPREDSIIRREVYDHPVFDMRTERAQKELWSLQGRRNTWFCGAHFGSGFHEDGLQAGLAVAEDLGGIRRPWTVEAENARIWRQPISLPQRIEVPA